MSKETTYYWQVVAIGVLGVFIGPVWSFTTELASPSSLTATAASSSQINLAWTDNSGYEDNYLVERSANGSTGWTQIASKAADSTSHSDTGLTASTTYYYRVRAYDSVLGYSDYSNTANATTNASSTVISPSSGGGSLYAYKASYPPDSGGTIATYGFDQCGQAVPGAFYYKYRMYRKYVIPAGTITGASLSVQAGSGSTGWTMLTYSIPNFGTLDSSDWTPASRDLLGSSTVSSSFTMTLDHTKISAGSTLYVLFISEDDDNNNNPGVSINALFPTTITLTVTWA
jgi:hypothetical protein